MCESPKPRSHPDIISARPPPVPGTHPQLARSAILPSAPDCSSCFPAPLFHPRIQMAKGSFQNVKRIMSPLERAALKLHWPYLLSPSHTLLPPSPHSTRVRFCQVPGYPAPSHLFSPPRLVNPSSSFCLGVTAQLVWGSSVTVPENHVYFLFKNLSLCIHTHL